MLSKKQGVPPPDASIIPQQVRSLGWNLKDFYSKLVEEIL